MPYSEAREHTQGRLHELFSDPYLAFDNDSQERLLHLRVMLYVFVLRPMERGLLTLRVLHGWENGGCEASDLLGTEYTLKNFDDLEKAVADFTGERRVPSRHLFHKPLTKAIASARARGVELDDDIENLPARWPAFDAGLMLYTLFKMCHRLVYGEDDFYRSSECRTENGLRELHEFHLEEGEFAFLVPRGQAFMQEPTVMVLHESQLEPVHRMLVESQPLFSRI